MNSESNIRMYLPCSKGKSILFRWLRFDSYDPAQVVGAERRYI